jgi:atypical dual specificity phosphatase
MTLVRRLYLILAAVGLVTDRGDWIEPDRVLGCAYPRRASALGGLRAQGISVLVNLHERAHVPERLARHGLTEVHVPVRDFTAPTPEQLARGVAAIERALADGQRVAVHCGGGIGRTGTLAACYLVRRGLSATEAIAQVRALRPGSVETRTQVAAIEAFAASEAGRRDRQTPPER